LARRDIGDDDADPEHAAVLVADRVVAPEHIPRPAAVLGDGLAVDHGIAAVEERSEPYDELGRDRRPDLHDRPAEVLFARDAVAARERLVGAYEPELAIEDAESDRRGGEDRLEDRRRFREERARH